MKIHDKYFEPYIDAHQLQEATQRVAQEITSVYDGKPLLILPVLNGAFMFASDVVKKIKIPCVISFVKTSSYTGMQSTGHLQQLIGLTEHLHNYHVLIVEDIVDTGHTIQQLTMSLEQQQPLSIRVACCLFKKEALKHPIVPDFVGFEIDNVFVVGYGLDYNGLGRNLPEIYRLKSN
jgi:hypoxanthine phosphoribosyltransferase